MRMTGDPKPFDIEIKDPVKRIQKYIDSYTSDPTYNGHEAVLMRNIRVIAAESAPSETPHEWASRAVFDVDVVPELCNPMKNMHGGAVSLVADMATTMAAAPAAVKGFWEFGGVSRTLGVTFLSPVLMGSVMEVECKLLSVGKRLSVIQCVMRDKKSRKLLTLAEHGKAALAEQGKSPDERKEMKL